MEPSRLIQILSLGLLLMLSGFFSAAEAALMSIDKIDIRRLYEQNNKLAATLDALLEDQNRVLSTILVLNNVVNTGASSLATALALDIFNSAGVGIATGVMTLLILMFGEITPKSIAYNKKINIGLAVCRPLYFLVKVLNPIVSVFLWFTNKVVTKFGGELYLRDTITEEELKTILEISHEEGVLEKDKTLMINNIFEFSELTAKEVMIPRTNISAINREITYEELLERLNKDKYSRFPIYERNIDNIKGVLYIKDLVVNNINTPTMFDIQKLIRPTCVVHEHKKISEIFKDMQKQNSSMAIVLDEYGGTSGLITKEDIVEEIFGDIQDEYDTPEIVHISDGEVLVDASMRINDLNEALKLSLESKEYDSVGGLILEEVGTIPCKGHHLSFDDCILIAEDVINNKILSVRIKKTEITY